MVVVELMMQHWPWLSILIWCPILSAGVLLASQQPWPRIRLGSVLVAILSLVISLGLGYGFDAQTAAMQYSETYPWLPALGLYYGLGIDGIALALIILTCFITVVTILATWHNVQHQQRYYYPMFLILQGLTVGVFSATNAILFYLFWEATLIPMLLIIGIWGSDHRQYAAIKFFLYMFLGSLVMLAGFIYLGVVANSFTITDFYTWPLSWWVQSWLLLAWVLGFAVKIPMWPVHTWLPHAHTEAPTGGSVVLAAILLKMGAYGFIRFVLPIVPDAAMSFAPWLVAVSLIAVVYVAFVALVQRDIKRLIAYSSIAHMGLVTLGCFVMYLMYQQTDYIAGAVLGLEGAVVIMISHGLVSAALFIGVGYLYDRLHTRQIDDLGGVIQAMPVFSGLFLLFAMGNVGLPGTSGFVGEWMVILAAMQSHVGIACLAATILIIGAAYTLWMYQRVFLGEAKRAAIQALDDIVGLELWVLGLLAVVILAMGIYPAPVIDLIHSSVEQVLALSYTSKL